MLFKKSNKSNIPVLLSDKREYVLTNPEIKDEYVRGVVSLTDYMFKSVNDIYDRIIIDGRVNVKNVKKILNGVEDQITALGRSFDE